MMRRTNLIAALLLAVAAGCSQMQPDAAIKSTAAAETEEIEVIAFNCWNERCTTVPDSRQFGLEVTYSDGTHQRIPFVWEVTDFLDDPYTGRIGEALQYGQWYATGTEVSVIRLRSTGQFLIGGELTYIEDLTVINHSEDNI